MATLAPNQLAAQLAGLKNAAGMKNAIMARLNIQPAQIRGFQDNALFDKAIGNLYTQGMNTSAGLDTQEGNIKTKYGLDQTDAQRNQDRALKALGENASGRGMLYSSDYLDQISNATNDYNSFMKRLGGQYSSDLGNIGLQRTNLQRNLAQGQMDAESDYGTNLTKFISDQAVKAWTDALQRNQVAQQQADQAKLLAAVQANAQRAAAPRTTSSVPSNMTTPAGSYNPIVPSYGGNTQAIQQAAALRKIAADRAAQARVWSPF